MARRGPKTKPLTIGVTGRLRLETDGGPVAVALLSLADGKTPAEVQELCSRSSTWVKEVKRRFAAGGIDAALLCRAPGRPARAPAPRPPSLITGPTDAQYRASSGLGDVAAGGVIGISAAPPGDKFDSVIPILDVRIPLGVLETHINDDGKSGLNWLLEFGVARGSGPKVRREGGPDRASRVIMPVLILRPCLHRLIDREALRPAIAKWVQTRGRRHVQLVGAGAWAIPEGAGRPERRCPAPGDLEGLSVERSRDWVRGFLRKRAIHGPREGEDASIAPSAHDALRVRDAQTHCPAFFLTHWARLGDWQSRKLTSPAALVSARRRQGEARSRARTALPSADIDLVVQLRHLGVQRSVSLAIVLLALTGAVAGSLSRRTKHWQIQQHANSAGRSFLVPLLDETHVEFETLDDEDPDWRYVSAWLQGDVLRDAIDALTAEPPPCSDPRLRFRPSPFLLGSWPPPAGPGPWSFVILRFVATGQDAAKVRRLEPSGAALKYREDGSVELTTGGFVNATPDRAIAVAEAIARGEGAAGVIDAAVATPRDNEGVHVVKDPHVPISA